jgi:TetR/AcrR family transcriptional repressor of mexJK operon
MHFGRAFLQVLEAPQSVALLRLMLGGATRNPVVADLFWQAGPMRGLEFLKKYLGDAMQAGQLRPADPTFAAMQFMGPLIMYLLSRVVFTKSAIAAIDAQAMLEQHVALFLEALRPEAEEVTP